MLLTLIYGSVVGIALGLTGGGGSIFAVPLLLYALGLPLREAVTVSLAVVGLTALYGAVFQRKLVNWAPGLIFGLGGILGAPGGAALGAHLPEGLTLLLFAGLMVVIATNVWRGGNTEGAPPSLLACRRDADDVLRVRWPCALKLLGAGVLTGILSGTFGVGGGFLVVPALLLVTRMPMERALATSLVCIALISGAAFTANYIVTPVFPLATALWFLAGGALGMTLGAHFKKRLSTLVLRRVFAIAVITMAAWITLKTAL